MYGKGPGRDLNRERAWRELVDRQRQSGLSVRGFCQRELVSEGSFYAWRRELLRRDRKPSSVRPNREPGIRPLASRSAAARIPSTVTAGAAAFLPVLIEPSSDHMVRVLEVICCDGSRVSAWSGCEVELLQAALSVVTRTVGVGRKGRVASC